MQGTARFFCSETLATDHVNRQLNDLASKIKRQILFSGKHGAHSTLENYDSVGCHIEFMHYEIDMNFLGNTEPWPWQRTAPYPQSTSPSASYSRCVTCCNYHAIFTKG
jgi:hypothetical protein